MKTRILLTLIVLSIFISKEIRAQKDSVIIESGIIDQKDLKRVSKHLKDQIKEGNLEGALSSAKTLNQSLLAKDLEKIVKVNVKTGRLRIAHQAALLAKRSLNFKEVYAIILINQEPFDTVRKYLKDISPKEAYQLQTFYIEKTDLKSAESSSRISGKMIKDVEYIKMSKGYFRDKNFDLAIISARKAGNLGREELGRLLKIFINIKDLDNSIKTALAIGGKNLSNSEWFLLKRIIPPTNLEDIVEFINTGKRPSETSEEAEIYLTN